jgi:hypothetical protein
MRFDVWGIPPRIFDSQRKEAAINVAASFVVRK